MFSPLVPDTKVYKHSWINTLVQMVQWVICYINTTARIL